MELQKGVWCGYQNHWKKANSKITYDKLLHSSTNMENPGIGLDTQSGIIACLNHFIIYLLINPPRSVHSPCEGGVESLLRPPVCSELLPTLHRSEEQYLDLSQSAEDTGDRAPDLRQRGQHGDIHRGAGDVHQGRVGRHFPPRYWDNARFG